MTFIVSLTKIIKTSFPSIMFMIDNMIFVQNHKSYHNLTIILFKCKRLAEEHYLGKSANLKYKSLWIAGQCWYALSHLKILQQVLPWTAVPVNDVQSVSLILWRFIEVLYQVWGEQRKCVRGMEIHEIVISHSYKTEIWNILPGTSSSSSSMSSALGALLSRTLNRQEKNRQVT